MNSRLIPATVYQPEQVYQIPRSAPVKPRHPALLQKHSLCEGKFYIGKHRQPDCFEVYSKDKRALGLQVPSMAEFGFEDMVSILLYGKPE